MAKTYISWTGEECDWPPPENWYIAADGRWWYPGGSPGTVEVDAFDLEADGSDRESPVVVIAKRSLLDDEEAADDLEVIDGESQSSPRSMVIVVDHDQEEPPETNSESESESESDEEAVGDGAVGGGIDHEPAGDTVVENQSGRESEVDDWPVIEASADGDSVESKRRSRPWLAMAAGTVLGVLSVYGISRVVDFSEIGGGGRSEANVAAQPGATSDPSTSTSIADDPSSTTSDTRGSITESSSTSTSPSQEETLAFDDEQVVVDFRTTLSENGLDSSGLTDDQILTFGSTYCVLAGLAENTVAFERVLELAISESNSRLSDDDLELTMFAAVVTFCPAEAERLQIDL